ncbi:MAG: hypothetical protein RLZZ387_4422 [Chloroflexota bacterium]
MTTISRAAAGLMIVLALLAVAAPGATVLADTNGVLGEAGAPRGSQLVLSGNISVPRGSATDGSLLVLCCNVSVDGEVRGDLALLSGNLRVGAGATVRGGLHTMPNAVNLNVEPGATVAGARGGIGAPFWLSLAHALCLMPTLLTAGAVALGAGLLARRRQSAPATVAAPEAGP